MSRPRVLVVDDKETMLGLLESVLGDACVVTTAKSGRRAIELATAGDFDVVLADIRMPEVDGFELLATLKAQRPDVEVVLMTAYGSVQKAVEAIKAGAYDYLTKPFEPDEALLTVERAAERKRLRAQTRDLRAALDVAHRFDRLLGKSEAMKTVFALLGRAAASDAAVLLTGESGTGKELAARGIHEASPRRKRPFVPVACAAIPAPLLDVELFGQGDRPGLYAQADAGTLFLDEVSALPLVLQPKLVQVLQREGARLIAASQVDLKQAVKEGRFREELYYRISVLDIHLPPLRERTEDLPLLAAHFVELHRGRYGSRVEGFAPDAIEAMLRHPWPGNVRELEHAVERALALVDGLRIPLEALPPDVGIASGRQPSAGIAALPYKEALEQARDRASRAYLVALMREFGGNVTRAAERAGMERESLHRLLRRHGIRTHEYRS